MSDHHARPSDPDTSHAAVPRNITAQCLRVLTAYRHGDAMIDHEAYRRVGMASSGFAHQRCSDLRHLDYIARIGERGRTPSMKWAHKCRITQKGVDYLDQFDHQWVYPTDLI